jgi:hypothetical protein
MAKRHPNPHLVKIHRSYTVEEIAHLFDIHKNTVRAWLKAGLPALDERRPKLIHGQDLITFLQARRAKNKRTCQPGEMYCLRCRAPKLPAGDMADYVPDTETLGTLKGFCPDCEAMMNRRVSTAKLELVRGKLDIRFTKAQEQLSNTPEPNVNSDFRQGEQP